ncbi:MAG: phytanoyl-CoA dioxygenase [Phenylobacterium sp.]|uniref:phytanoyl-CoA dioxygenase family protein n=1 Tax=Phenylobacterium sp. TaxID=1871053 RepID=UPI0025EC3D6A|nr:phytanoyl-CoA dioxygenase family protein [Phenylobacterium sp.]MBI1199335.1 phytanoyl-CoA dioxygenase [Phenylobacterium sp.]
MNAPVRPRFWEQPVRPSREVDLDAVEIYRRGAFPAETEPSPWLDRIDAEAQIETRLAHGEITGEEAELCRKWARDGYVILEGFYDHARLDAVWVAYEAAIAAGEVAPPHEPIHEGDTRPGRTANAHFAVRAVDEMLFDPKMSHIVSVLMGAEARPFQTIIGHKSSQQLEHSDSIHMSTWPQGYLAANWIAFEDVHADSGPLVYYPGSHRLPYLMSEDLGIPAAQNYEAYNSVYEPAIQAQIAEHGLKPAYFLPRKGDVLLWHANLLHGGSKVRDVQLTRKALVCHFFAKGCVCYHDLTGTLAHVQLGQDLYTYKPQNMAASMERSRAKAGDLIGRARRKLKASGVKGLVSAVLAKASRKG